MDSINTGLPWCQTRCRIEKPQRDSVAPDSMGDRREYSFAVSDVSSNRLPVNHEA